MYSTLVEDCYLLYICRVINYNMKLSPAEEKLIRHLWKLDQAYMKDIIDCYDNPKPATTTIATLLKRMIDKGMVKYVLDGKNRRYRPAISKSAYFSNKMKGIVSNFFGNSNAQFASFFTQSSDFTKAELEELKLLIEDQIKAKEEE